MPRTETIGYLRGRYFVAADYVFEHSPAPAYAPVPSELDEVVSAHLERVVFGASRGDIGLAIGRLALALVAYAAGAAIAAWLA